VTAGNLPTDVLPASQVAELINGLVKALRAFHMYLPNNPIYQRATENVRIAFIPIWNAMDELVLNVVETDFVWEEQVVYHQLNKSESLAWGLFKDGMRSLSIRRGAEHEELPRFLETINRARYLPTDAGDDLLTLLWEQEFQFIQYHFVEFFGEGGGALPEQTGTYPGAGKPEEPAVAQQRHAEVVQEAAQRPKGVVDLEEFDSTLYFLEESEINYVATEVEAEYKRDVRASALNILFDLVELEGDPVVRGEIISILESLFPNFLNARDFRTAALVLREAKLVASRAPGLSQDQHQRLDAFVSKLSEPAIVSQLVQSLDEVSALANEPEVAEVLRELRQTALEPVLTWIPSLSSPELRGVLEGVVDRLAGAHTTEVLRILRTPSSEALGAVIALCGRLGLHQAVPGLGETVTHADPAIRLASVQTLAQLGTPAALGFVDKAIGDADRGVRVAAVRVAGNRGYKGALKRVEQVVLGKTVKDMDLTEKMAFFEAYGSIAGAAGLKALTNILLPRGLLKLKESPETRACAAIAIGKIRSPEAREVLQRAAEEKDLVVRNAVNRALREGAA
jgi:HEAT repeat protein